MVLLPETVFLIFLYYLSMGNEKGLIPIAPKHGEVSGNLPITERSGPAAADDILTFVEQKFYM